MGAHYLHLARQLAAVRRDAILASSTQVHTFPPQFRYYVRAPQKISEVPPSRGPSTSLNVAKFPTFNLFFKYEKYVAFTTNLINNLPSD